MTNIWFMADPHYGHQGVTKFLNKDGSKLRPWDSVEEMDEALVENHNAVVKPKDKVYILGDVVINRKALKTLALLKGDLILVKGNHDIFKLEDYTPYFRDIRAYCVIDNLISSHIPLHPESKGRFRGNIHGHLHSNKLEDPWYQCVSMEQINYTPIAFEELKLRFNGN
jgi:calcineurin-like phosphoesterase family protein